MNVIMRKMEFDAGHRVLGHGGKCKHLHGHRYVVELTVTSKELDGLGMVVDFSCLKGVVGKWIDDNLDHNFIINPDDPLCKLGSLGYLELHELLAGKDMFVMPEGKNPTAENLAKLLYYKSVELLKPFPIKVLSVRIWETPNCYATFQE